MSKDFLSDEDKALFRQAVQQVTPLKKGPIKKSTPQKKDITPSPAPAIKSPTVSETIYLSDSYPNAVSAETPLCYSQHSIPKKRFLLLKKGLIPWDARLDLHGLRPEEAREKFLNFLLKAQDLQYRSLLIIHGKGGRHNETPVLKNLVNHWLSQIPQVLAFHSAEPKDGGNGAVYVLLKRHR